jgi:hypothetical protein
LTRTRPGSAIGGALPAAWSAIFVSRLLGLPQTGWFAVPLNGDATAFAVGEHFGANVSPRWRPLRGAAPAVKLAAQFLGPSVRIGRAPYMI